MSADSSQSHTGKELKNACLLSNSTPVTQETLKRLVRLGAETCFSTIPPRLQECARGLVSVGFHFVPLVLGTVVASDGDMVVCVRFLRETKQLHLMYRDQVAHLQKSGFFDLGQCRDALLHTRGFLERAQDRLSSWRLARQNSCISYSCNAVFEGKIQEPIEDEDSKIQPPVDILFRSHQKVSLREIKFHMDRFRQHSDGFKSLDISQPLPHLPDFKKQKTATFDLFSFVDVKQHTWNSSRIFRNLGGTTTGSIKFWISVLDIPELFPQELSAQLSARFDEFRPARHRLAKFPGLYGCEDLMLTHEQDLISSFADKYPMSAHMIFALADILGRPPSHVEKLWHSLLPKDWMVSILEDNSVQMLSADQIRRNRKYYARLKHIQERNDSDSVSAELKNLHASLGKVIETLEEYHPQVAETAQFMLDSYQHNVEENSSKMDPHFRRLIERFFQVQREILECLESRIVEDSASYSKQIQQNKRSTPETPCDMPVQIKRRKFDADATEVGLESNGLMCPEDEKVVEELPTKNWSVAPQDANKYVQNWTEITSNTFHESAEIFRPNPDHLICCDCVGECLPNLCGCRKQGAVYWTSTGKIARRAEDDGGLYECNVNCPCYKNKSIKCVNRRVQLNDVNPDLQFEVFHSEKTGWGLRTKTYVPKSTYICEYLGEYIDEDEADRREAAYKRAHIDNYLWTQNNMSDTQALTLDATCCGNISRFINHSHDPNLIAYPVHIDCIDVRVPRIAFFSLKEIGVGTELTIDYHFMLCDNPEDWIQCHCNAVNCPGRLR
jgi:hypothetical protein